MYNSTQRVPVFQYEVEISVPVTLVAHMDPDYRAEDTYAEAVELLTQAAMHFADVASRQHSGELKVSWFWTEAYLLGAVLPSELNATDRCRSQLFQALVQIDRLSPDIDIVGPSTARTPKRPRTTSSAQVRRSANIRNAEATHDHMIVT